MKKLLNAEGVMVGVSSGFIQTDLGWVGDDIVYPLSVVGEGCKVEDYVMPPPVIDPPAPESKWVSRYAFMARFTADELAFIKIAGIDNPAKPMPERIAIQKINVIWDMVMASTYIDLNHLETRAGVKSMEAFGLLTAGRANEILDAPVQESERYKG